MIAIKMFALMLLLLVHTRDCFMPATILDYLVDHISDKTSLDFGKATDESLSHEEIIKRGILRSVAKFLYDQPAGNTLIDSNLDLYTDINSIYKDFFGRLKYSFKKVKLEGLLDGVFTTAVASVDIDPTTKDMPYAHFDAEKFNESNQRVKEFIANINANLDQKNYNRARELTGQVLHTIQDFYSHSNWIEMGNSDFNRVIGTNEFDKLIVTNSNEVTCRSDCTLVQAECSTDARVFIKVMSGLKLLPENIQCPFKYYKCSGNIVTLNKLVSGYYTNQKLADGTPVPKPSPGTVMKCSHGGLLDTDSFNIEAVGGINKDSGFYLFSPHAHLHSNAARLAILHTQFFFDQIRARIGDENFNEFLQIIPGGLLGYIKSSRNSNLTREN